MPPLQLVESFFSKVVVDAKFDGVSAREVFPLQTRVDFQNGKNSGEMLVRLGVRKGANSKEDKCIYVFEVEICGIFSADPALFAKDPDKAMSYIRVNGSSMLLASAREIVAMLTSRGPFQTYIIPTLSFLHLANQQGTKSEGKVATGAARAARDRHL